MGAAPPEAGARTATTLGAAQLARVRHLAYRVLTAVFLYPEAGRMAGLQVLARELLPAERPWTAFAFYPSWQRLLQRVAAAGEARAAALAGEYARLFLVQPAAPPQAAYYLDPTGSAAGWLNAELDEVYAEAGVAVAGEGRDGPDFVATQLEFMAYLCDREARAWTRHRGSEAMAQLARQQAFLGRYLAPWFPLFARQVRKAGGEGLYATAAGAAEVFIRHDLNLLRFVAQACREEGLAGWR